jgi:NNP family nitrate/nitrite transporter-like MFS transporter
MSAPFLIFGLAYYIGLGLLGRLMPQLQVFFIAMPLNILLGFSILMFVLGIAWAIGKASVFKYISDDYPTNIGTISGIVGLAGGLGGFLLPIMFGALLDLTGVRSTAFMLMYAVVWVSLIWMYWTEVRRFEVIPQHAVGAKG